MTWWKAEAASGGVCRTMSKKGQHFGGPYLKRSSVFFKKRVTQTSVTPLIKIWQQGEGSQWLDPLWCSPYHQEPHYALQLVRLSVSFCSTSPITQKRYRKHSKMTRGYRVTHGQAFHLRRSKVKVTMLTSHTPWRVQSELIRIKKGIT